MFCSLSLDQSLKSPPIWIADEATTSMSAYEAWRGAVRWATHPARFLSFFFFRFLRFCCDGFGVAGSSSGFVKLPMMGRCFRFWVCEVSWFWVYAVGLSGYKVSHGGFLLGFGSRWARVACGDLWGGSRWVAEVVVGFWSIQWWWVVGYKVCLLQTKIIIIINKNITPN